MKWPDTPNTTPCGILIAGEPRLIAKAGRNQSPPFLWYWAGDMNIRVVPRGNFDEKTGQITDGAGETHGWVAPITDMPEVDDLNRAMAQHAAMVASTNLPDFQHFLAEQLKMASNSLKED